jgi:hypothetical protein
MHSIYIYIYIYIYDISSLRVNIIGLKNILRKHHYLRLQVSEVYDKIIVKIELVIIGNYRGITADMS